MVEYGGTVRQGSGAGGGRGGTGSFDVGGDIIEWLSDMFDRVASLPPEVLVLLVVAIMVGGFVMSTRTS